MPPGLRIPTVTQVDLQAFQARCFGKTSTGIAPEANAVQASYEDDDGLCCYSNSVRRTLTDDQIAMFRHSEIYTLLRERRYWRENRDASEYSSAELEGIEEGPVPRSLLEGDEEEEYARFLEREQKQLKLETMTEKRKRSSNAEEGRDEARREAKSVARELNGGFVRHDGLDYGDGAADGGPSLDGVTEQRMQLERGRRRTVYEDDTHAGAIASVATDRRAGVPLEKKTFVWPRIGN
ncbi:MAG: hypothetical protein M1830_009713 [Pleopsidium flavum]|nr:MAG: hypothetical protein M1830_009713 [Pleopsidium flavum]